VARRYDDERDRILHAPIHDPANPAVNLASLFRPVLCRPTSSVFADFAFPKKSPPPPDSARYTTRLGYDYQQSHQAYYTDDPDAVNCTACIKKRERLGHAGVRGLRARMDVLLRRQENTAREIADLAHQIARLDAVNEG